MREIDFTPDWYRAKCKRRRDVVVHAMFLGTLLTSMILLSIGRHVQTATARERLETLRDHAGGRAGVTQRLMELEGRLAELQKQQSLLSDVAGGAPVHGVLAELSRLMPEKTTLKDLRLVRKPRLAAAAGESDDPQTRFGKTADIGSAGVFEITGWAASDTKVGSLMTNMAGSDLFRSVTLDYSRQVVVDGHVAREFRLTCELPQFE